MHDILLILVPRDEAKRGADFLNVLDTLANPIPRKPEPKIGVDEKDYANGGLP